MPSKPLRPCSHVGCPKLVSSGKCDEHKTAEHRHYNRYVRDDESKKFYNSARWRQVRVGKMRLNPLCEECQRNGQITAGVLVDHIVPWKDGGSKLDLSNLQTLCTACHNKKGLKERG
jgi:5-methylcytosine-specific restriction protein A